MDDKLTSGAMNLGGNGQRPLALRPKQAEAGGWPPAYLALDDVAHELRVSTRQARRLLSAGRLPSADLNVGSGLKGRRWRRDSLLTWLAGRR